MTYCSEYNRQPDALTRGALELTFHILRGHDDGLAFDVRQQLQEKSARPALDEQLRITLDARTIGQVVAALTYLGQEAMDANDSDQGRLRIIRSLMRDWVALGEWMIMQVEPPSAAIH